MKRRASRALAALALSACIGLVSQGTASASPGGFHLYVEGGGSISPGLTSTPTAQSGTFSGTVAGTIFAAPGAAIGLGSCNFSFSSTIAETAAQGQGTASGSCSGGTIGNGTISASLTYTRAGAEVTVVLTACEIIASGPIGTGSSTCVAGTGEFEFTPTSGNGVTSPITAYALAGTASSAGV